jgi:tetratricopeptide (TPR) repeat protein
VSLTILLHTPFNKDPNKNTEINKRIDAISKYASTDPRFAHLKVFHAQVTGNEEDEKKFTEEWEKLMVGKENYEANPAKYRSPPEKIKQGKFGVFDLYDVAHSFAEKKDYSAAAKVFFTILQKVPKDPRALTNLAMMCFNLGDITNAEGASSLAIDHYEVFADGWAVGGFVKYNKGQYSLARDYFNIANKLDPSNRTAILGLKLINEQTK